MEFMHHERWQDALFLHYEADAIQLQNLLPPGLVVDTFEDKAYVGVVALSEIGITPAIWFLPCWLKRLLSLSHHAVNVRTYVRPEYANGVSDEEAAGIYFFTLDCSHVLPAIGARLLFNLPYRLANMMRRLVWNNDNGTTRHYWFQSTRWGTSAQLDVEWKIDNDAAAPALQNSLGTFFVERYCLYNTAGTFLRIMPGIHGLWCGSITHAPWPLQQVQVGRLFNTVLGAVPGMNRAILSNNKDDPIAHFSPGVSDIRFYFQAMPTDIKKDS
jgi:uncharacterized protein YqjF (DUF2071 family)